MWNTVWRDRTLRGYQALDIVKRAEYDQQLTPSTYSGIKDDGISDVVLTVIGVIGGYYVVRLLVQSLESFCAHPLSNYQFDASLINKENECSPYVKGAAIALAVAGPILGFAIATCLKYQINKHYNNKRLETNVRHLKVMELFNKYPGADSFLPLEDNDLITLMELTDSRVWTHLTAYMSPLQFGILSQRGSEKVQGYLKEIGRFTNLSAEQLEEAKSNEKRRVLSERVIWTNLDKAMAGKGDEKLYLQAIEKACAYFDEQKNSLAVQLICDFTKVRINNENLKIIGLAENFDIKKLCSDFFRRTIQEHNYIWVIDFHEKKNITRVGQGKDIR